MAIVKGAQPTSLLKEEGNTVYIVSLVYMRLLYCYTANNSVLSTCTSNYMLYCINKLFVFVYWWLCAKFLSIIQHFIHPNSPLITNNPSTFANCQPIVGPNCVPRTRLYTVKCLENQHGFGNCGTLDKIWQFVDQINSCLKGQTIMNYRSVSRSTVVVPSSSFIRLRMPLYLLWDRIYT